MSRGLLVLLLVPGLSGCYDRDKCQPELWGPVGAWDFISLDQGVVMTNRLFDGWQRLKGCCTPESVELEYPGEDRPWLLIAGSPASYGLRFSTATTGACDPRWVKVSVDGVAMEARVKRRTVFEYTCVSPHGACPEESLYEEVADVVWDWTPPAAGYSTVEFEWGGYTRVMRLLIAEPETEAPVVSIPARCSLVQRVDEDTWLCDRVAYQNGVAVQSWADSSLVASVGEASVVEWGDNRVRLWRFDGGAADLALDLDAGVSPLMRWDGGNFRYLDRDDIFVLDGGRVLLDAAREVLFLDGLQGPSPRLSRTMFGAQVVSVHGQPVSVLYLGDNITRVCLGLDGLDGDGGLCQTSSGMPLAAGSDGVWLWNGRNWAGVLGFVDGGPFRSTTLLAETLVDLQFGQEDYLGGRPSDAGEPLRGHRRRMGTESRHGGCVLHDVQFDGGLIPRVYPEVGEWEPPSSSWSTSRAIGGSGEGDWRWCIKEKTGVTFVYRAPLK